MPCYARLGYVLLCFALLCYAMLRYSIFSARAKLCSVCSEIPPFASDTSPPGENEGLQKQKKDPNPKDNSLIGKQTSTYKGFHSTFAALFSY